MKASRLILLAVAQLCCAGLMAEPAAAASVSAAWSNLWHTPDQQGQALLDAGQAAQAADRFHDPRRRAYADLQAGRYQDAAKLLAPFTDAESEYNRGNALAKAGRVQAALAAYDAALKQSPADKDIRHNRDLVERALQQKRQSTQSSSRNGRQGRQGTGSSGQQPRQSTAGQQGRSGSPQSGGSQQSGGGSPQSGGSSQQSGASGQQSAGGNRTASNGSQTGSNPPGSSNGQNSGQNGNLQQPGSPQPSDAYGSGTSKETKAQAQSDAALAANLARKQQQRGASGNTTQAQAQGPAQNGKSDGAPQNGGKQSGTGSQLASGTETPKQKPETERQLALDQWLRQIPDSPAGLLQRKFLIEHMMKQQDSGNPQDSGQ